MGFDVQAFATGFLESRVKDIEKKGDEARAFEENQRTLADRNTQTLSKRNAVVQQVVGLSNMLRDNGASERVIQAAIAAGPQEITTLANKVTEARKAAGGGKLGSSDIEALVNIPEGFSVMDTDTTNLIRKTYGLGYEGKGVTKDMPERSFMDRLRGDKQMDMARARLDREVIKDGYTAYDVNQMSAQQDYESLVPGTFITFNDIKVFRPREDMDGFTRTINNLTKAVEDTGAYSTLDTEIKGLIGAIRVSEDQDEVAAAKARLPKAQAEMDELYLSTVGSTIQDMVDTYGESFTDNAGGYLRSFLSESYVDSLALGTTETDADTQTEDAFSTDTTSTGVTIPEVTVTELPPASEAVSPQSRPVIEEEEPKEEPKEEVKEEPKEEVKEVVKEEPKKEVEVVKKKIVKPKTKEQKKDDKQKAGTKIVKKMGDKGRYDSSNQLKTLIIMNVISDAKSFFNAQTMIQDTPGFFSSATVPDAVLSDNNVAAYLMMVGSSQKMNSLINSQYE